MPITLIRHMAAVLAAWLITTLIGALGLDVGPDDIAALQAGLTTLGAVLLLALYASLEKALKPLFLRFGEQHETVQLEPGVLEALEKRKEYAGLARNDFVTPHVLDKARDDPPKHRRLP